MNVQKLAHETLSRGFPELVDREVVLIRKKMKQYGLLDKVTEKSISIFIDASLAHTKKSVVVVVAHELCHAILEQEMTRGENLLDTLLYERSTSYTTLVERNTDLEVILRGFGQELLDFHTYLEKKHYKTYKRKDGLTHQEVITLTQPGNKK